jgi:hypothetical protein
MCLFMLAVQPSHFETRLAYRLWMLTCPNTLLKRRVSVETIFQNFALIHNILHYYHIHYQCAVLFLPHSLSQLVGLFKFSGFFLNVSNVFYFYFYFFYLVLTLTSASPIPIDTNEVGAREPQVRCFGCLLIECLANFHTVTTRVYPLHLHVRTRKSLRRQNQSRPCT